MNKADIQRIIDGYSAKAHELRQTAKAEEAKADELKKERNNKLDNMNLRDIKAKKNAEPDFKAYLENSRAEEAKHREEARTLYRIVKVVEECEVNATAAAVLEAIKADPKKYGKPLHYKRTRAALKEVLPEGVKIWESGRGSAQIGIDFISYDTTLIYNWTPEAIESATAPDTMEPEEIESFTRKAIKARAEIIAEYEAMETALNKKKEEFINLWALNDIFPSIPILKVTYI